MPEFAELCLDRMYFAVVAANPSARPDLEDWLAFAARSGFLDASAASDAALCRIMLTCDPNSTLRSQAETELRRRTVPFHRLGELLLGAQPPQVDDLWLMAAMDQNDVRRAVIHEETLAAWFLPDLVRFMTRMLMHDRTAPLPSPWLPPGPVDGEQALTVAGFCRWLIYDTYRRWSYPADGSFACELFGDLLNRVSSAETPEMPNPPPTWFVEEASPHEQQFIRLSLTLDPLSRAIIFSVIYAGLSVFDLARCYRSRGVSRECGLLRDAWTRIFGRWVR